LFTFIQEIIFEIPGELQKKSAALSNFMVAIAAVAAKGSKE